MPGPDREGFGARGIFLCFAARYIVNLNMRIFVVFTPFLAVEFGIPLWRYPQALIATDAAAMMTSMLSLLFTGKSSPRATLVLSEVVGALATAVLVGWAPPFLVFVCARFVFGASRAVLSASVLAVIADCVPEERRGRAIGVVESSWWLAGLTLPLVGAALNAGGNALSRVLAVLVAVQSGLAFATHMCLPAVVEVPTDYEPLMDGGDGHSGFRGSLGCSRDPQGLRLLAWQIVIPTSCYTVITVMTIWWNESFGLGARGVGSAATLLAMGEILGSLANMALTDRVGFRAAVVGATLVMLLSHVSLCVVNMVTATTSLLPVALAANMAFQGAMEIAILAAMVWVTACSEGRGHSRLTFTLMCRGVNGLGKCLGTGMALPLYTQGGVMLNAAVAATLCTASLVFSLPAAKK